MSILVQDWPIFPKLGYSRKYSLIAHYHITKDDGLSLSLTFQKNSSWMINISFSKVFSTLNYSKSSTKTLLKEYEESFES